VLMRILDRAVIKRRDGLEDVIGTDIGINRSVLYDAIWRIWIRHRVIAGLPHAAQKEFASAGQILQDGSGLQAAGDNRLGLLVDAQLAGITVIVDVVRSVGSEEPGIGS